MLIILPLMFIYLLKLPLEFGTLMMVGTAPVTTLLSLPHLVVLLYQLTRPVLCMLLSLAKASCAVLNVTLLIHLYDNDFISSPLSKITSTASAIHQSSPGGIKQKGAAANIHITKQKNPKTHQVTRSTAQKNVSPSWITVTTQYTNHPKSFALRSHPSHPRCQCLVQ